MKKQKIKKPKPVYVGKVKVKFKNKKEAKTFFNLLITGGW